MKAIRSNHDLAANGAVAAFDEPRHVGRPNLGDRAQFLQRVNALLDRQWITNNGPLVQELEQRIASMLGVKHCVAMCNGTVALEIAIRALGLEGEVIVPSHTFVATAHALSWQAITPVFADVDPQTQNLDPAAVLRMITPRTSGIIGVHLWGRPAPVQELQSIADAHGLQLMFDAAHAFGCSHRGRRIGGFGRCEVFSFHATKVFNTFEGGAVVTDDRELAEAMRLMRNFGFAGYDNVIHPGTNGKMPEINAAMGLTNLDALPGFVDTNRRNYERYRDRIAAIPGLALVEYEAAETPNYQYVVALVGPDFPLARDRVVEVLHAENLLVRKYFWPGCHRMKPYRELYPHAGLLLEQTERIQEQLLVLPTGAAMSLADIDAVCDILTVLAGS